MDLAVPLLILMLDQGLKLFLYTYLPEQIVLNPGVAFGVGSSWLVGLGMILFIWLAWQYKLRPRMIWWSIIAAYISNDIDRVRLEGVIDYFRLGRLHFNLADIAILLCVSFLILHTISKKTSE